MKRQLAPLILSALCLNACAVFDAPEPTREETLKKIETSRIYFYPYDKVWKAAQLVIKYPLVVSNMDTGVIETDVIKGVDGFVPPGSKGNPNGLRYILRVQLIKGITKGKASVKIVVTKQVQLARDFFSEPENLVSDGLEEKTIFYRIGREIGILQGIDKMSTKQN